MEPQQIFESISGGFFALDAEYRFTYWNKAAEEGTGLLRSEVLGKHIFEIFPNAEYAELGALYRRAMETKTFQSLVTSYKDSRFEKWYDVRIYPSENGLSVFLQDITEQKRHYQQSETLLKISHTINTSNQFDDICRNGIAFVSSHYELPQENILLYLFRPHDQQLVLIAPEFGDSPITKKLAPSLHIHDTSLAVIKAFTNGEQIITADISQSVYYSVYPEILISSQAITLVTLPLKIGNEMLGVCEIIFHRTKEMVENDISFLSLVFNELAVGISRRALLDELRSKNIALEIQKSQTQEAHSTLKKFLAFFSHELRSPLNSIIGFSELISKEISTLGKKTIKEYISAIYSNGEHLLSLINDILDLSKIESGKMELHYSTISLSDFFSTIQKNLHPQLEEKKINLQVFIVDEIDVIVADNVRLKQIFLNIVSNAIKFSYPETVITLSVQRVGYDLEFSVQDYGVGMHPEEQAKLFQPFQQTFSGAGKSGGTGLGLAITKKLVELHGGSISVISEWQKGSTFSVRLPIMVHTNEDIHHTVQKISAVQEKTNPTSLRILIAEDKPQARTLLKTYLDEAGYSTEIATNGIEAIEKAKLWKPDIITLDIVLPVKDGWQVLKELKEHPLCKNIPVIIISMMDERTVGFGLGAIDYFVKPVQKEELLSALHKISGLTSHRSTPTKILVIDDDPSVTELMKVILESEGCTVIKASNGTEGISLAEKERPDLIILDLVMPELSGFSVAYQLKHNTLTHTIPIMIMTSMEIDDDAKQQLEGFVVSLMKKSGFTKRDLLQEIALIERK